MKTKRRRSIVAFVVVGLFATVGVDALAVVGMPATPVSYAGVARRTVRRTAYVAHY